MSKYRFALLTTAVMVVTLVATAAVMDAADGPKLMVPENIMDMGKVAQGEVLNVDFVVVNEGDETLEIKAVRPTCGCTVADFDREIAPGKTGYIKAKLDTRDFSGPISKSILVMTNDPQDPTRTLVIKTEVHPYVQVLPRALVRFNAVQHEPMEQKITVVADEEEKDFKVNSVKSSVPFLLASVRPVPADQLLAGKSQQQYEITLTMQENPPVGPVNTILEIETNHPKAKTVPVKVFGVVRALLHVTPSQIQFGAVEAKKQPGRNVIVVNNRSAGVAVTVTGAAVNDPAFNAEVVPIENGRRYQVTVTVNPDASAGPRDAVLTLKTSDPEFPTVEVPVRANIS
ncbi:MAG: DUF1573 domain-containing protein [Acidobacteriota bacterium]|nr:DUF1573 domain-containing protein [Acidobacteriota bacterium]